MRLIACVAAMFLGGGVARANQLITITLPDRHRDIPSKWLTYPGPPRADVLLPDRYDSRKRYPLIVLLPGFSNTYAILGPSMLDAQKVLAGLRAIVVSPEGETGWYTDWYNRGAYGTPEWESYILDEAIPQIVRRYKILPQRRYHALFGVSMGGLGAAYLGGRAPGFFGSIGVLSGFVDLQIAPAIVSLGMDGLSGVPPGTIIGPEHGFYATGHNPTALVHNLQYTRVFVSAGNGIPTPPDGTGGGVGNAEEAGVIRPMSNAYASALRRAKINLVYHTHTGCHCWPDFQAELRDAIAWGPFKRVVEHPTSWVNQTVATHGQLWGIGYRFASHPTAVVSFTRTGRRLQISDAGTAVTLTMSGGCVLRTATPATVTLPPSGCGSSSGPSPADVRPIPGKAQSFTYGSGLAAYPYLVYTPSSYRPRQRLPLIVMLHGCQTTAYQQMEANLYNPLADKRHFVVVYPDVNPIEVAQPGPTKNCWQYPNPQDWHRGEGDDAAVAGITRTVMRRWNVDPQRVYLMGMSAGAFLTADMAATYPDLYAAVGENAGADYEDWECTIQDAVTPPVTVTAKDAYSAMGPRARIVPKIVIGGDADQGIPPACADRALQQTLRTNNLVIDHSQTKPISLTAATVQHRQKPGGYSYTISNYVDQYGCVIGQRYLVHGMNHFWSGGSSNPKWKYWTDPKGPSAALASWTFFSHFTLANTRRPCRGA